MKKTDFDGLLAGLEDALAYAKGQPNRGTRETAVEVDRTFVAAARLKAGLTQQEFARVAGASLGTVRKWERGERSPSGAARMLAPILARDPALVIAEAGLAERIALISQAPRAETWMWEVPPLRFFAICRDVPPTSVARVPPEAWNGGSVHAPSQWLPLELEAPRSPARNSAAEPHSRPPVGAPRTSDPRSLRFSFPQLAELARTRSSTTSFARATFTV